MFPSANAYDLIEASEGFSPVVYACSAGHATIGYGHKLHSGPPTAFDRSLLWTLDHANIILELDTLVSAQAVTNLVKVPLNQNQFDALVSWTFNLGVGWLRRCSWRKALNAGNYAAVPAALELFTKAGGETMPGLVVRRGKEAALFEKPIGRKPS